MTSIVPIFLLDLILLPGEEIELHIYEDRYKSMFKDLGSKYPCGGIMRSSDCKKLGTTFEIVEVLNVYQSGECDVLIRGISIFEMEGLVIPSDTEPYPLAAINILDKKGLDLLPDDLLILSNEVLKVASGNENRAWSPQVNLKEILIPLQLSTDQKEEFLNCLTNNTWIEFLDGQMQLYIIIQNQMRMLKGNFLLN